MIALVTLAAVAVVCALGAVSAVVYAHIALNGERREYARKEQLWHERFRDLLDRNMHLTDGGAWGVGVGATRRPVRDSEPLEVGMADYYGAHDGVLADPEGFGGDLHALYDEAHRQPTLDEVT